MTKDQQRKIVDDAALALGEFFDCVQIVVSCPTDTGTRCIKSGVGNWYARRGMCQEFCEEDSARTNAREIGEELKEPPDDGWKKA